MSDPQVQYPSYRDHLQLWNKHGKTDKDYVKKIEGGRYGAAKLSNIDPTYQFMRATEEWGPMGHVWGLKDIRYEVVRDSTSAPVAVIIMGTFFAPGIEIEQIHNVRWDAKGDMLMGARTHLIKKALSNLGFSHQIHMGEFDDQTYMSRGEELTADQLIDRIKEGFQSAEDEETLKKYHAKATTTGLKGTKLAEVNRAYDQRRQELMQNELSEAL